MTQRGPLGPQWEGLRGKLDPPEKPWAEPELHPMHPLNPANSKPGFKELIPSTTDYSNTAFDHGSDGWHEESPGWGKYPTIPAHNERDEPGSGLNSASTANSKASHYWASAANDSVPEGVEVSDEDKPEGGMSHLTNGRGYADSSWVAYEREKARQEPNRERRYPMDRTPEEKLAAYQTSKTYGKFLPNPNVNRGSHLN